MQIFDFGGCSLSFESDKFQQADLGNSVAFVLAVYDEGGNDGEGEGYFDI